MPDTEPMTLEEICTLPFDTPEAAAQFQAFLDEMAELAAALPPEEPTEEPAARSPPLLSDRLRTIRLVHMQPELFPTSNYSNHPLYEITPRSTRTKDPRRKHEPNYRSRRPGAALSNHWPNRCVVGKPTATAPRV